MEAATCTATASAAASVTTCPAAFQVASSGRLAGIGTVWAIVWSFLSLGTRCESPAIRPRDREATARGKVARWVVSASRRKTDKAGIRAGSGPVAGDRDLRSPGGARGLRLSGHAARPLRRCSSNRRLPLHRRRHRREPPGMCAGPGGRAVVQRPVHDRVSLQYQRMPAHAWPPSGTSRPSGSAIPHKVHWTTSSGRRRLRCVASDAPAGARRGLTRSCSGPVTRDIVITAEACGAMIPPRGTPITRPPALRKEPGTARS